MSFRLLWIHESSCLNLLSAGITDVCHHILAFLVLTIILFGHNSIYSDVPVFFYSFFLFFYFFISLF
jgi:hypothetical protein